jgi:hypothetical protein
MGSQAAKLWVLLDARAHVHTCAGVSRLVTAVIDLSRAASYRPTFSELVHLPSLQTLGRKCARPFGGLPSIRSELRPR